MTGRSNFLTDASRGRGAGGGFVCFARSDVFADEPVEARERRRIDHGRLARDFHRVLELVTQDGRTTIGRQPFVDGDAQKADTAGRHAELHHAVQLMTMVMPKRDDVDDHIRFFNGPHERADGRRLRIDRGERIGDGRAHDADGPGGLGGYLGGNNNEKRGDDRSQ